MLLACSSKRFLRAAGGAEAALLGKHALQPVVGRAVRRALHDDTQMVLCMRMRMFRLRGNGVQILPQVLRYL